MEIHARIRPEYLAMLNDEGKPQGKQDALRYLFLFGVLVLATLVDISTSNLGTRVSDVTHPISLVEFFGAFRCTAILFAVLAGGFLLARLFLSLTPEPSFLYFAVKLKPLGEEDREHLLRDIKETYGNDFLADVLLALERDASN